MLRTLLVAFVGAWSASPWENLCSQVTAEQWSLEPGTQLSGTEQLHRESLILTNRIQSVTADPSLVLNNTLQTNMYYNNIKDTL